MDTVVLYHIPPSFYSQIARIALRELAVDFEERMAPPGPPTYDTYQPWYLKLNPMGTVPTMVHGSQAIPDSEAIMRYAAEHLSDIDLEPSDPERREEMEAWITSLREVSLRELSYSSDGTRKLGARVNRMRLKVLERRRARHPEMAEVYTRKIDDIRGFAQRAVDPEIAAAHKRLVAKKLDDLDTLLSNSTWITGESYSLADLVWTVGVARFIMLDLDPLEGRANLGRWYALVRARPSFADADVWESFKPLAMLRAVSIRFRAQLVMASAAAAGSSAALVWFLSR